MSGDYARDRERQAAKELIAANRDLRDAYAALAARIDAALALHVPESIDFEDAMGHHTGVVCAACGEDLETDDNQDGCPTVRALSGATEPRTEDGLRHDVPSSWEPEAWWRHVARCATCAQRWSPPIGSGATEPTEDAK